MTNVCARACVCFIVSSLLNSASARRRNIRDNPRVFVRETVRNAAESADFNVESNRSVSEKRITRRAGQALGLLQSIFNPHIPAGHVCFHVYSYSGAVGWGGSNGGTRAITCRCCCSIARNSSVSRTAASYTVRTVYTKVEHFRRNEAAGTESTKTNSKRN